MMKLNFDFLKDAAGVYNFGRIIPAILFLLNTLALALMTIFTRELQYTISIWHVAIYCSGFITGCIVYFVEIFCRERVKIKVSAGGKEYGIESGGAND